MMRRWLALLLLGIAVPGAALAVGGQPTEASSDEAALERLAALAERHPDDRDLSLALARALAETGRLRGAAAQLERHLTRWPDHPRNGSLLLGRWLHAAGRSQRAIAPLQRAVEQEPLRAEAHLLLGLALRDAGRPQESAPHFERAAALEPRLAGEAWLLAGLARLQLGDRSGGDALLRRVIALDPDAEAARSARLVLDGRVSPPASRLRLEGYSGLAFDSNVTLESDEISLADVSSDEADLHAGFGALARGRLLDGERTRVDLGARYDGVRHFDLDDYDTQRFLGFVSATRDLSRALVLRLDAWGGGMQLDGDPYLLSGALRPSLFAEISESLGVLRLHVEGEHLHYEDDPQLPAFERSGWAWGGGLDHWLPVRMGERMGGDLAWISLGGSFRRHDTEAERDALGFSGDYDHDRWRSQLRSRVPLPWRLRVAAEVGVELERYAHENLAGLLSEADLKRRRDTVFTSALSLTRELTDVVDLELAWSFLDRDSNVRLFSHDRHVVGLTFRAHTP